MTQFKKYAPGVYCLETENAGLSHGDALTVATRHGKEVDVTIWKKLFTKGEMTYYSYTRDDGFCRKAFQARKLERANSAKERQEKLSGAYYERSNKDRDFLSLGEPIKVGHHSEKRHRKIIEQANNNMARCVEADEKAKAYEGRIGTLADRIETEINLDTPDCLDALSDRVGALEKQRDALKASKHYESYQITNLGANIRRYKERLDTAKKLWEL